MKGEIMKKFLPQRLTNDTIRKDNKKIILAKTLFALKFTYGNEQGLNLFEQLVRLIIF